jgi:hypothetical protein
MNLIGRMISIVDMNKSKIWPNKDKEEVITVTSLKESITDCSVIINNEYMIGWAQYSKLRIVK